MKKIYVADDERSILDALEFMLVEEGYQVRTSSKGYELLRLKSDLPDLIVLDLLLSGEDGRQICKKLKMQENTRNIPIVMISAHPNVMLSVKECGADDFIPKPFDMHELLTVVSKYCDAPSN